jgi:hypothetical protein
MSTNEEIRRLETELEINRQHFREDTAEIRHKIDQTKAELSLTNLVRKRVLLALVAAVSTGFAVGYFLDWQFSPKQVAGPVLEHIGKPAARSIVTTAGKELVMNSIRGKSHGRAEPAPARGRRTGTPSELA